ncbi:MAG: Fe-S-containing protein [Clostridiales bacterium]|nr:Fe-S-containing protein [Clostridiales bacterium]
MLKYLIQVVQNFLTTGILLAMLLALARLVGRQKQKWLFGGLATGVMLALILAILKSATALINREYFNIWFLSVAVLAEAIFFALSWGVLQKKWPIFHERACKVIYAIVAAFLLLYSLPDIFLYPTEFVLPGESALSTDFLFKLIGYLAGLLIVGLSALALYKAGTGLSFDLVRILTTAGLAINMVNQLAAIIQPLLARRIIPMKKWLFGILKPIINHNDWFLYTLIILTAIFPLALWVKILRTKAAYQNPAQHRKIRSASRSQRRWCAVVLAGYILSALSLTVVKALDQREVILSPAEPINIVGNEVIIPLESVNDGHLHRYAYKALDGVEVRFIVIQKNATAYGVGLDACDICGPTGYYERDDEVVCKLCDVVMNKSTIGFKGGCNPVPLAYIVSEGSMVIKIQDLENEKKRFA